MEPGEDKKRLFVPLLEDAEARSHETRVVSNGRTTGQTTSAAGNTTSAVTCTGNTLSGIVATPSVRITGGKAGEKIGPETNLQIATEEKLLTEGESSDNSSALSDTQQLDIRNPFSVLVAQTTPLLPWLFQVHPSEIPPGEEDTSGHSGGHIAPSGRHTGSPPPSGSLRLSGATPSSEGERSPKLGGVPFGSSRSLSASGNIDTLRTGNIEALRSSETEHSDTRGPRQASKTKQIDTKETRQPSNSSTLRKSPTEDGQKRFARSLSADGQRHPFRRLKNYLFGKPEPSSSSRFESLRFESSTACRHSPLVDNAICGRNINMPNISDEDRLMTAVSVQFSVQSVQEQLLRDTVRQTQQTGFVEVYHGHIIPPTSFHPHHIIPPARTVSGSRAGREDPRNLDFRSADPRSLDAQTLDPAPVHYPDVDRSMYERNTYDKSFTSFPSEKSSGADHLKSHSSYPLAVDHLTGSARSLPGSDAAILHSGASSEEVKPWSLSGGSRRPSYDFNEIAMFAADELDRGKLSRYAVMALVFFNVSGGPWGSEEMFKYGPLEGILAILTVTIFWSLPQIQLTSELASCFPVNGGYSLWVTEAFGPFWGFQESYWSWIGGVVDNAVYPVLIFDGVKEFFPYYIGGLDPFSKYLVKIILVLILTIPNFLSTTGTGKILQFLGLFQLLPFVIFIAMALPRVNPEVLIESSPPSEINYTNFLLVCFWNLSGWDCVSTVAGEIENPSVNLSKALMYSLFLTVGQYILILSVAAGVQVEPWASFTDGSLPDIVKKTCGDWIGVLLLLASCMGNAGMFIAELMEDSYQLEGLTSCNIIPRWTRLDWKHPRFGTPWVAILPSLGFCILCVSFEFHDILAIDNCFTSAAAILEILAFFEFRRSRPEMERPFKTHDTVAYVLLPCALVFGFLVFYKSLLKKRKTAIINIIGLLLGVPGGKLLADRFAALYLEESLTAATERTRSAERMRTSSTTPETQPERQPPEPQA